MGRRKIEIKAIKDDRNRSVTFLKRKGGLFKKAHELSVLCSVDVAVIIFGHNKKLYEYSSGDINETIGRHQYYGGAHEHKGPADFAGKRDSGDEDDEEVDEAAIEETMAADQHLTPHMHGQPGFAHIRHGPSASPPIGNGMPYHQRQHTPQPQMGSRPSSRNANSTRRPSSTLGHQITQGPPIPNGYAYMPGPQGPYNPHAPTHMPMPHPGPQPQPHPQFQYPPQPPQHPQMQQNSYMQDGRRQSMPPAYPPNDRPQHPQQQQQPQSRMSQPPQPQRQSASPPRQEPERRDLLQPQQPKPMSVKSKSIFTPIDDSRSMLAGQWGFGGSPAESRQETAVKQEKDNRPHSVDVAVIGRNSNSGPSAPPQPSRRNFTQPQRTQSTASLGGEKGRPQLSLQIPSEHSDDGEGATGGSSPKQSGGQGSGETPVKAETSHSSGVVLPPPSPSASALLSAGAQGPPNPFARPLPPGATSQNNQAYNNNNNIDTPMSALPSRFVADQFLPSPSSFYPDWGFGGGRSATESNMLPSPLNFQTPVAVSGPNFSREDEGDRKRKSPDPDTTQEASDPKRVKA